MKPRQSKFVLISVICLVVGLSLFVSAQNGQLQGKQQLIMTPNPQGHPEFLAAINSAKQSIFMEMYHLTDQAIVTALIQAKARNVAIRVILDGEGIADPRRKAFADQLVQGGVPVLGSSPAFKSITHSKAMVIDGSYAFVTAINLTDNAATTRDFGLILNDPLVVKEMLTVFSADWANAQNKTALTPPLTDPNLVWSPINSDAKLTGLLGSASKTIVSTVENLGNPVILNAYVAAAARGVNVRLIVPRCDKNSDPAFNYRYIGGLTSHGVNVRVMPAPETPQHPYMHSKMILTDNAYAYIGSINFSMNSMEHARELGIIFGIPQIASQIAAVFEQDWSVSEAPGTPPTPTECTTPH